jgi:glutamate 5-kinase
VRDGFLRDEVVDATPSRGAVGVVARSPFSRSPDPNPNKNPKQVIKVGTSSLIHPEHNALNLVNLAAICETVKDLHAQGHYVILVSSGAVGVGCQRLGLESKPPRLAQKQALAAVGQVHLMRHYADLFAALGLTCAQVLLTLDNLANRDQYVNARNTFHELLAYGAVPVVNENDTVAVQELRFGDNDTLSAQVAALVGADYLFLMTDVDALYTGDPRTDPTATPVWEVEDIRALTGNVDTSGAAPAAAAAAAAVDGGSGEEPTTSGAAAATTGATAAASAGVSAGGVGSRWGTGGMATKLTAARIATSAGCTMVILSSAHPRNIARILKGEARLGTRFHPVQKGGLRGRRRWVLSVPVRGSLFLDGGAVAAVRDRRKSLFAAGVVRVQGSFHAQDAVSLRDAADGQEFARGLVSFSSSELAALRARAQHRKQQEGASGEAGAAAVVGREAKARLSASASRADVAAALGYSAPAEVVHRGNLALLEAPKHLDDEEDEDDDHHDHEDDEDEELLLMQAVAAR